MMCLITKCNHKISRQGRANLDHNCWGRWQVCVCCSVYLELIDGMQQKSLGCKYYLQKELAPPPIPPNPVDVLRILNKRKAKQIRYLKKMDSLNQE